MPLPSINHFFIFPTMIERVMAFSPDDDHGDDDDDVNCKI